MQTASLFQYLDIQSIYEPVNAMRELLLVQHLDYGLQPNQHYRHSIGSSVAWLRLIFQF